MTWYDWLLVVVALERLAELVVVAAARDLGVRARRHRDRPAALPADGRPAHRAAGRVPGRGARGRPAVPARARAGPRSPWSLAAQALRWWCIATLGNQWNTRVIVVPGARPGARAGRTAGCSHPNYVAVAVEGAALPLVHTAWVTALAFTVLNAILLLRLPHPHRGARAALGGPARRHDPRRRPPRRRGRAGRARRRDRGAAGGAAVDRRRAAGHAHRQGVRRGADARRGRGAGPARRAPRGSRADRDPLPARRRASPTTCSPSHPAWACAAPRCTSRWRAAPAELGVEVVVTGRGGAVAQDAVRRGARGCARAGCSACDGLHSTVRRQVELAGAAPRDDRRYGVRRHFRVAPWTDLVEVHWGRHVEAYVTPVADDVVGVAMLGPPHHDYDAQPRRRSPTCAATWARRTRLGPARGAGPLHAEDPHAHRGPRAAGRRRLRLRRRADRRGRARRAGAGRRGRRARSSDDVHRSNAAYEKAWTAATRDYRLLTSGLLAAAGSPLRRGIVPLAAAAARPVRRRRRAPRALSSPGHGARRVGEGARSAHRAQRWRPRRSTRRPAGRSACRGTR